MANQTQDPKTKSGQPHHQKLAHWMDDRFTIPGTDIRFGLDPVISLIPGAGYWFAGMISSYFILLGVRSDVAPSVLMRMGFNVLLDVTIGSIPLLGDIFDVGWKANTKNAELLEEYRSDAQTTDRHSKGLLWTVGIVMFLLIILLLGALVWLVGELFEAIF
jgi:hypothetical protein